MGLNLIRWWNVRKAKGKVLEIGCGAGGITLAAAMPDAEIEAFYAAGFDAGHLVELIAATAMNIFTNYFNHIAATDIDFPVVSTKAA